MSSITKRIWSLDILRGFFILLMLFGHTVAFMYGGQQPFFFLVQAIANVVSFTGLLFVSGAAGYVAYIHDDHPSWSLVSRIGKRLGMYLLGYYGIALWIHFVLDHHLQRWWEILSFAYLPPYSEFIVTFLIFGLLKIPLRSWYRWVTEHFWRIVVFGGLFYLISDIVTAFSLIPASNSFLAIWFGLPGVYSFSVFRYFIVYLLGLFVGRHLYTHELRRVMQRHLLQSMLLLILAVVGMGLLHRGDTLLDRWPPSSSFISTGLFGVLLTLFVVQLLHNLRSLPWIRRFLILLGQNTFALFFTHTYLLYVFSFFSITPAYSDLLLLGYFVLSLWGSIILAKWLPLNYLLDLTFVQWCECNLGECSHAQEHRIVITFKRLLLTMFSIPSLFSIEIGKRRIPLFRKRYGVVLLGLFIVTAIPLGMAEDDQRLTEAISKIQGTVDRHWFLYGAEDMIRYSVSIEPELLTGGGEVDFFLSIDDEIVSPLSLDDSQYQADLVVEGLATGTHTAATVISMGRKEYQTSPTPFYVTQPLLVSWTIDWEGYEVNQSYLDSFENISARYHVPMTQLFNPRIYTSESIPSDRADFYTNWVIRRRDVFGDEIGLHLHMFPDYVAAAGLEPRLEPAWGGGFSPGYDILTSAYPEDEMLALLKYARELFQIHGLGEPVSYRAGGWFADEGTLAALDKSGFLVDSSGRTSYTFGTNGAQGHWDLSDTTQPYHPSAGDQNKPGSFDALSLLEVPNNGADSFAFSAEEMIRRFTSNYQEVLDKPTQVTYLSHPHWFNSKRQDAMRAVFDYIDRYAFEQDRGPVIFVTLSDMVKYWE